MHTCLGRASLNREQYSTRMHIFGMKAMKMLNKSSWTIGICSAYVRS